MNFLRILIVLFGIVSLISATFEPIIHLDESISEQDATHIKEAELLACGIKNCNVIREFSISINKRESFDCYVETLPIRFRTILPNGTETFINSFIPLLNNGDIQDKIRHVPYNIVRNTPISHDSCLRIRR